MTQKIAIIVYSKNTFGGGEIYAINEAKYFRKRGYIVDFIYSPNPRQEEYLTLRQHGISCIEWDFHFRMVQTILFLRRYLLANPGVFVATHNFITLFCIEIARLGIRDVPHLTTVHFDFNQMIFDPIRRGIFYCMAFIGFRLVPRIVTVSRAIREVTAKTFHLKLEKFTVIHNGLDFERLVYENNDVTVIRNKLLGGVHKKLILYVGRLDEKKGVDNIIGVIDRHLRDLPIVFAIVGDGPMRPRLEEMVRDAGIENQVYFAGHQPSAAAWYAAADLFVFMSLAEGLPGVLLEAMYFKLPIVASDIPMNRELINHGINGILLDSRNEHLLTDAIRGGVEGGSDQEEMAARGKEMVSTRYSFTAVVKAIEAAFEELSRKHAAS